MDTVLLDEELDLGDPTEGAQAGCGGSASLVFCWFCFGLFILML